MQENRNEIFNKITKICFTNSLLQIDKKKFLKTILKYPGLTSKNEYFIRKITSFNMEKFNDKLIYFLFIEKIIINNDIEIMTSLL